MTEEKKKINIKWLHAFLLVIIVLVAYGKVLNAGFMTWDDADYVLKNSDVQAINMTTLQAWFSSFYIGNYHPLTIFSYAIDYMAGGEDPTLYHLTNILLHIANAL